MSTTKLNFRKNQLKQKEGSHMNYYIKTNSKGWCLQNVGAMSFEEWGLDYTHIINLRLRRLE